jgi:hypothetical protein
VGAGRCCLRYIKGTWHLILLFPYSGEMFIARFSDSDSGNFIESRESVSGYLFKLGNLTMSWQSPKQKSLSTSTTEAKYVALSKAAKPFLWLKTALQDLQFPGTLIALFCDNRSAIDLAANDRISKLSTYIDIHHHHVQEFVNDKTLPLIYIFGLRIT